jgi:hypothetical protein
MCLVVKIGFGDKKHKKVFYFNLGGGIRLVQINNPMTWCPYNLPIVVASWKARSPYDHRSIEGIKYGTTAKKIRILQFSTNSLSLK